MPSIPAFARRLYRWFPVVRELRQLRVELADATAVYRRIAQEDFVTRLLREDRYRSPKRLNRHEHQVFSQNGEDGIIREIFRRVGARDRTFLELGVGNGQVNNTTFLLTQGWNGYWLEGSPRSVGLIRRGFATPLATGQLKLLQAVATAENAVECLKRLGVPPEIDLLSVDLDRNTYWVLAAILEHIRPRAAVVEYNATYPPDLDWKAAYDPGRWWNRTSYFGASLKAYEQVCRQHGLALVGCDLHGVNAFFVREDLCGDRFETPFTAETHYEPARYYLARTHGHPPCFSDLESPPAAASGESPRSALP
jgi:hypothetical protein